MINQNLIIYPCLSLFLLCVIVLIRMFLTRVDAIKNKTVDFKHFKTYSFATDNLPVKMVQASRNFTNLFEVPTLFFMICLFALITKSVDPLFLALAWSYVFFRYFHSFIHLTSNKIMPRMSAYALSWLALVVMAIVLLCRI